MLSRLIHAALRARLLVLASAAPVMRSSVLPITSTSLSKPP